MHIDLDGTVVIAVNLGEHLRAITAKVIPLQTRRASRLTTQSLDVKGRGGEIDMRFHRVALEADGSTGNGMMQRDEPMRESMFHPIRCPVGGGVTCGGAHEVDNDIQRLFFARAASKLY